MLPENSLNHHLVYKPKRPKQFGPGAGAELYYVQLVSEVDEEAAKERPDEPYAVRKQKWRMKLEDLPEVTRKPVTSRSVLSANFGEGDALALVDSLGYTFVSSSSLLLPMCLTAGHCRLQTAYFTRVSRLVHNNIVITLTKILLPQAPADTSSPDAAFGSPFPWSSLAPLDPAESWVLKVAVRVQSNHDVEGLNTAVNELKGFKDLLKGMCDLEVAERLALDTRVR